jgi:ribosomal protein L13E
MSTDVGADATDAQDVSTADYDEMLATLDIAIDEARRKIENGRIRDVDREKARVKQWRALGYLINVRRQVANDRDLEALAEEIEELKSDRTPEG